MCLQKSLISPWHSWNWAGDQIVHEPIIPACRPMPGGKLYRYPIDIRAFLTTANNNAVVGDRLRRLVRSLSVEAQPKFRSYRLVTTA